MKYKKAASNRIEESRLEEFHQTLLQMIEVIGSYFEAANEEQ